MEIRNLNEDQAQELHKKAMKMMEDNPDLEVETFLGKRGKERHLKDDLEDLNEKLDKCMADVFELKMMITRIFGNHFLMDGRFIQPPFTAIPGVIGNAKEEQIRNNDK